MALIEIKGVPHYIEWICADPNGPQGDKPIMLFIHGWGGSGRYWESTAHQIKTQYDCLLYDLRGFGRSTRSPSWPESVMMPPQELAAYEIETYAEDLQLLLQQLKIPRVSINAHSLGGSIAVVFSAYYDLDQRVERLILTCNGIFDYNPLTFKLFHWVGGLVVSLRPSVLLRIPQMDRLVMARFLHQSVPQAERKAFLADYLQADQIPVVSTIYTFVSKRASQLMPAAFRDLAIPTLLVVGAKDIIIPARLGQRAASLNSQIHYTEIPQTGHFPMLEDPQTYLRELRQFLQI